MTLGSGGCCYQYLQDTLPLVVCFFHIPSRIRGYYDAFADSRAVWSSEGEWPLLPEGTARTEVFCAYHDSMELLKDDAVLPSLQVRVVRASVQDTDWRLGSHTRSVLQEHLTLRARETSVVTIFFKRHKCVQFFAVNGFVYLLGSPHSFPSCRAGLLLRCAAPGCWRSAWRTQPLQDTRHVFAVSLQWFVATLGGGCCQSLYWFLDMLD